MGHCTKLRPDYVNDKPGFALPVYTVVGVVQIVACFWLVLVVTVKFNPQQTMKPTLPYQADPELNYTVVQCVSVLDDTFLVEKCLWEAKISGTKDECIGYVEWTDGECLLLAEDDVMGLRDAEGTFFVGNEREVFPISDDEAYNM